MNAPSVDVVFSADWNIFGYDPNGFLAYLVAYFFGPEWLPDTFDHLPCWEGEVKPPRYGPPGSQQSKYLPLGWKCTPPPHYYGAPSGPYLPPPRIFRPSAFADLVNPHPRVPPIAQKEETGGFEAFRITIRCSSRGKQVYFRIPSDMKWWVFRSKVCRRMGINYATSRLAYRHFHDILYGSLCRLRGAADWAGAMARMKKASEEDATTELEIIDVASTTLTTSRGAKRPITRSAASAHLSDRGLDIETYYFSYPKVEDLLKLLDNDVDGFVAGWSYKGINLSKMLRSVDMRNMDDFVTTSPLALHTSCGVPARAVELLYIGAEKMIRVFHKEMAHEIKDLREHREAYGRIFLDQVDDI